ncbi:MAG: hypothetical protein HKN90_08275 [Flavobacteriaceae bacterium]|nr:hypothetical protein [Flavobacteriaceae bacterium]
MRFILFLFLFSSIHSVLSQEEDSLQLIDSIPLVADVFVGLDNFEDYYYIKDNTLYKKTLKNRYSYTNTQLGPIASVDVTNPLKILVFYRDFNTIMILDNRLNELTDRINLSEASYGKNATFASISSNNNLWLYSLDDNILTLWNYEKKEVIFESQPLQFYQVGFEGWSQISNYEKCWLASNNGILEFNQYGSFIKATVIGDIKAIQSDNNHVIIVSGAKIYSLKGDKKEMLKNVDLNHLSTNFFVNKNTLVFFRSNMIFRYRIFKN